MRVKAGIKTWGGTEGNVEKRSIYLHSYFLRILNVATTNLT
jgi:hypothetical protein